jgi:hypothetical protein
VTDSGFDRFQIWLRDRGQKCVKPQPWFGVEPDVVLGKNCFLLFHQAFGDLNIHESQIFLW